MKKLLCAAALAALVSPSALAQTTTTPPQQTAPERTAPAPSTPQATTPQQVTPPIGTTGTTASKSDGMFYTKRADWRASKLVGAKVQNNGGETIGDINEVLLDKDGKVAAVVVGVGGFLGMGERHAAVSFSSLQLSRDSSGNPLVRVNATKEQIKGAPEWKWDAMSTN